MTRLIAGLFKVQVYFSELYLRIFLFHDIRSNCVWLRSLIHDIRSTCKLPLDTNPTVTTKIMLYVLHTSKENISNVIERSTFLPSFSMHISFSRGMRSISSRYVILTTLPIYSPKQYQRQYLRGWYKISAWDKRLINKEVFIKGSVYITYVLYSFFLVKVFSH